MSNDTKYKRWAWGALIGLAAVIIVAGLVMAMTLTSPKPNDSVANTTAVEQADNNQTNEGKKNEKTSKESEANSSDSKSSASASNEQETTTNTQENSSSASENNSTSVSDTRSSETDSSNNVATNSMASQDNASDMPKTGPEELIVPIIALAICGYLFAYNAALFKKNA